MAVTRVSPGVYRDEKGNTFRATTQAEAQKMAGKSSGGDKSGGNKKKGSKKMPDAFDGKRLDLDSTKGVINAQDYLNEKSFEKNIAANRPDQQTAYGSRKYVKNPDGTYSIVDSLSEGQQGLLDAGTEVGTTGSRLASGVLNNSPLGQGKTYSLDQLETARPLSGSLQDERNRIEQETYGRLTRDFGEQKADEQTQLEQSLFNRGISPGSDAYQKSMDTFNKKWSRAEAEAKQNAVTMGGQEFERSFNIGSTARANEIGERQGELSFGANLAGSLAGLNQGPKDPNFVGFSQVQNTPTNVESVVGTMGSLENQRIAASRSGGGGGGGAAPQVFTPGFGGVPPSYTTPQPKGPSAGQNIASGIAQGISSAVMNQNTAKK